MGIAEIGVGGNARSKSRPVHNTTHDVGDRIQIPKSQPRRTYTFCAAQKSDIRGDNEHKLYRMSICKFCVGESREFVGVAAD